MIEKKSYFLMNYTRKGASIDCRKQNIENP